MSDERRRSERVKQPLVVQYAYRRGENNEQLWDVAIINDISGVGASFNTSRKFKKDESMMMRMRIPSSPLGMLNIEGKTIGSSDSSVGVHMTRVEFVNLNEERKEIINSCIEWFAANKGGNDVT
ncbi:MAG TPA: PilZ domain-containing protein [Candidatus Omnitrophica bacterium]|nr:PilZ domain-containing protein [Candidatus Omnitrophota bacterium]